MSNFEKYAAFYDLLYVDKDYAAEAEYVADRIRQALPHAHFLLEFGSGTGRHGRLLASMGFEVHGIERSPWMVSVAHANDGNATGEGEGSFTCEVGDIGSTSLNRRFDAVIALFHVMSYQTSHQALEAAFRSAAQHLVPDGVFLFDVWHGPAVLAQGPSKRTKEISDDRYRVKRTALPEMDMKGSTVKVIYDMECEDRTSGQTVRFSEQHVMRYLFPADVELLAQNHGMRVKAIEEFLTGRTASSSTWSVSYLLQR